MPSIKRNKCRYCRSKKTKKHMKFRSKKRRHGLKYRHKRGGMPVKTVRKLPTIHEEEPMTETARQFEETRTAMKSKLENPSLRQSNMLSAICNDSTRGACLDFGVYRQQIKTFFNDYLLSSQYSKKMKLIGAPSNNGFILQVEYERDNYKSYSVIKCNQQSDSDNLLYEYYVGINFVNHFVPIFPCFIETYEQLYFFDSPTQFNVADSITDVAVTIDENLRRVFREVTNVNDIINPLSSFANNACKFGKSNSVAIMLQYFDNVIPFNNYAKQSGHLPDGPNILFQIYFVLNILRNEYTHYDLHAGNVLLYKPYVGDKFIEMHYHFNDGKTIAFPTEYVAKIIDYGRNFFHNTTSGVSSQNVVDNVCSNCNAPECMSSTKNANGETQFNNCGELSGIFVGEYGGTNGSFYNISVNKKNVSHDLRLVSDAKIKKIVQSVSATPPIIKYDVMFGTPEIEANHYSPANNVIYNVSDMLTYLKKYLKSWNNANMIAWSSETLHADDKYNKYASPKWTKMGEIHVYENRKPYEFIPSTY